MKTLAEKDTFFKGPKYIYTEKIEPVEAPEPQTVDSVRQKLQGEESQGEDKKALPAAEKSKPSHLIVDPRIRKPLATKQATVMQATEHLPTQDDDEEEQPVFDGNGLSQHRASHHSHHHL